MGRHVGEHAKERICKDAAGWGKRDVELVREGAAPYVDDAARPGRPALALAGVMWAWSGPQSSGPI